MKVLLDIKDTKANFVLELLKNFSFVKTKSLSPYKAEVLENLKDAVEELNKIRKGKIKGIVAKDLLNEF
jgi:hypothetical protein